MQKCDRFIEALDSLQKAHALAPEDKTIAGEMEQLLSHISKNVIPLGVGCTFSWGLASTGGLGHPEARDKTSPTSIAALARKHVVDVSCGAMHTGKIIQRNAQQYEAHENKNVQLHQLLVVLLIVFIVVVIVVQLQLQGREKFSPGETINTVKWALNCCLQSGLRA